MAIILTIANQKGGSGKTTNAVNLSDALAELGKTVLLIDGDYQGNATGAVGVLGSHPGLAAAILQRALFTDFVVSVKSQPLIDVLPGTMELNNIGQAFSDLERNIMIDPVLGIIRQGATFQKTTALKGYDYVIIDTHPSLDSLLTAALAVSDGLVIPLFPEKNSVDGLKLIYGWYSQAKLLNAHLAIAGCLVSNFDQDNATHKAYLNQIRLLPEKHRIPVFNTVIPTSKSVPGASAVRQPLSQFQYSRRSPITQTYRALAREIDALYKDIRITLVEPPVVEKPEDIEIAIDLD
jgi:chromosome partitioning protein